MENSDNARLELKRRHTEIVIREHQRKVGRLDAAFKRVCDALKLREERLHSAKESLENARTQLRPTQELRASIIHWRGVIAARTAECAATKNEVEQLRGEHGEMLSRLVVEERRGGLIEAALSLNKIAAASGRERLDNEEVVELKAALSAKEEQSDDPEELKCSDNSRVYEAGFELVAPGSEDKPGANAFAGPPWRTFSESGRENREQPPSQPPQHCDSRMRFEECIERFSEWRHTSGSEVELDYSTLSGHLFSVRVASSAPGSVEVQIAPQYRAAESVLAECKKGVLESLASKGIKVSSLTIIRRQKGVLGHD
ncbi:MAG: hypothetical protein J5J00_05045 [Deltaproteobacteria bacterium]|nr:hypothetical protein [Deltaproteobacteria bacterium]